MLDKETIVKVNYHKPTGKWCGTVGITKVRQDDGTYIPEFPVEEYAFIEMKFGEWMEFWKQNKCDKQIFVRDEKLESEDLKKTLEELKHTLVSQRIGYRKQIFEEWFDDLDNMPQEIKTKLKTEKDEAKKIEKITRKEDLTKYE